MHSGFPPLLARHRIFHSGDTEEGRAFLATKQFSLDLAPGQKQPFDMRINGVYLPGMYIGYIQYGPAVDVRAIRRDEYWIQLPVRGRLEVVGGADAVTCDPARAAIASPTRSDYYLIRSGEGCAGIRLCLFRAAFSAQLAALLGEPAQAPLEFASEMDATSGHGQRLARYVLMAVNDLDDTASMLSNPIAISAFEQFVMTGLLLSQPHNLSAALARHEKRIAPRAVRRALDYVEAHLDRPITLPEIVAAAGVAGRTLFKHFRDFKGVSPMRYLRDARFGQARQVLLRAEPEQSVTDIAMKFGFVHMGRFAVEYRARFGESPSQTIRRRKRPGSPAKG
jgi:AraC-like DNA-binding protein